MHYTQRQSSWLIIIILLVLLLHAALFIFLFIILHSHPINPATGNSVLPEHPLQDEYKLVQHLRAGTPGAPSVIFQNPAEKPIKDAPSESQPEQSPSVAPDSPSPAGTQQPEQTEPQTPSQRLQNEISTNNAGMIPLADYAGQPEDTEGALNKKEIKEVRKKEPLLGKAALMKKNLRMAHQASPTSPGTKRSNLTFAQLVDGFNTAKARSDAATSIMGREGIVDAKQMVFENYCRKIEQCLKITNSIHRQKFNDLDPKEFISGVYIELKPNGSLVANQLIHSSGNPYADGLALFLFQESASSFPPVPASLLAQGSFPMRWRVHFNATHSFGLQLSN